MDHAAANRKRIAKLQGQTARNVQRRAQAFATPYHEGTCSDAMTRVRKLLDIGAQMGTNAFVIAVMDWALALNEEMAAQGKADVNALKRDILRYAPSERKTRDGRVQEMPNGRTLLTTVREQAQKCANVRQLVYWLDNYGERADVSKKYAVRQAVQRIALAFRMIAGTYNDDAPNEAAVDATLWQEAVRQAERGQHMAWHQMGKHAATRKTAKSKSSHILDKSLRQSRPPLAVQLGYSRTF